MAADAICILMRFPDSSTDENYEPGFNGWMVREGETSTFVVVVFFRTIHEIMVIYFERHARALMVVNNRQALPCRSLDH